MPHVCTGTDRDLDVSLSAVIEVAVYVWTGLYRSPVLCGAATTVRLFLALPHVPPLLMSTKWCERRALQDR